VRNLQRAVIAVSVAVFIFLLWKLDARAVFKMALGVGWGFLLILPQEGFCHFYNAAGWRFAFPKDQAQHFKLRELWLLRVLGDSLNYLTPSATIGGEVARALMLHHAESAEARASSVVVAKFTQILAQISFVLGGFLFVVSAYLPASPHLARLRLGASWVLTLAAGAYLIYSIWGRHWIREAGIEEFAEKKLWGFGKVPWHLRMYFRHHPWRMGASVLFFLAAYVWSAIEAWLICHFIGVPVRPHMAMAIEVLSIGIDAVLLVPGKIGVQEGGKTAVFALLGLPPASGFAFGLIRHMRELTWAFTGMAVMAFSPRFAATRERKL
jgi:uncharacterized protein (TIRG00374 family)